MSRSISEQEKDLLGLLEKIFTTSQEAVCVVQEEAFVFMNHTFLILFGYHSRKEIADVHPEDIFSDKLLGTAGKKIRAILAGASTPFQEEIALLRPDGTFENLKCSISEISFRGGSAHIIRLQNVTEYRSKIDSLEETEEIFRFLSAQGGVGFYVAKSGKIVFASEELPKILGIPREALHSPPGKKKNKLLCYLPGILHTERGTGLSGLNLHRGTCEYKIIENSETSTWFLFQVKKIDIRGVPGVLVVVLDITEKKLELDKKWFQEASLTEDWKAKHPRALDFALAGKAASLGRLTQGIIHEMNNSMTGITGFASLAKSEISTDHPIYEYIDLMEKTSLRTRDLLGYLEGYAQEGDPEQAVIDLNKVASNIAAIITRTFHRAIKLERRHDGELLPIRGFWSQLEFVLMTLCLNARDAMPKGGTLAMAVQNVEFDQEYICGDSLIPAGQYVRFSLAAVRSGKKGRLQKLAPSESLTTGQKETLSAIGLSMASTIVSEHNGYMDLASGTGTAPAFSLYFPVCREMIKNESNKPVPGDRADLRGTILLVDDEMVMRSLARAMLGNLGYKVILAEDGETACSLLQERNQEIDLILLDITMPGMRGEETLLRLQQIQPGIAVVITSGASLSEAEGELQKLGARAFLQKPFLLRDLKAVIDKSLRNAG